MRPLLVAILLLVSSAAAAQTGGPPAPGAPAPSTPLNASQPLTGVWVPAELLQALQADTPREIPCYLVIEAEPDLQVLEECGGGRTRWTGAVLEAERAGRLEVRAGEQRRLVFRAGTPNELELARTVTPGEPPELVRLYRLPAALEERLRSWAAAQQILVGTWRTGDGAEVAFAPDGSFTFAQEHGRYRLQPGAPLPGTWAVLDLQPSEGEERIYLLTGAGRRVGLVLPPAHLVPALRGEMEQAPAAGQQERGMRPGEAPAAGGQEPGTRPEAPPAEGAGGAGPVAAAPQALEVAVWLERTGPGVEQQATAPAAPAPEVAEPEAAEPPPIAQPIEPKRRCGCSSGEGVSLGGLLALAALARRRSRRQHGP